MWSNCCPLKIACDRSSFFFAFGNRKECMMREPPFNLDIAWKSRELPASSSLFLLKWGQGGQKPHRWRCLAFAGKKFSLSHDMTTLMGFWALKSSFVWSGFNMPTWGSHSFFLRYQPPHCFSYWNEFKAVRSHTDEDVWRLQERNSLYLMIW